jgi:regulator of replication initiation timing
MSEIQSLKDQLKRVEEEHEQLRAKNSTLREALLQIVVECDNPGHGDPSLRVKSVAMSALEDEATVERDMTRSCGIRNPKESAAYLPI